MKSKTALVTTFSLALTIAGLGLFATACSETKSTDDGGIKPIGDSSTTDGSQPPPLDCVKDPQNATDIVNRCPPEGTEYVDKTPVTPLLKPDGTLPPLP
jgi:hypothetical protein